MPKTQGTVGAVEQKQTQAGKTYFKINVNGTWYSAWQNPNVSVGDEIEFDVIQKGEYKNMANPVKVAGNPGGGTGNKTVATSRPNGSFDPDREARIVRQNATSSAVALVGASKLAGKADVETVLATVREVSKKLFELNMYGYGPATPEVQPPTPQVMRLPDTRPSIEATIREAKATAGFFDE